MSRSVFEDIPPLCAKTSIIINEVFSRPEMVMCKFVLNLYHGKLQVCRRMVLVMTTNLF